MSLLNLFLKPLKPIPVVDGEKTETEPERVAKEKKKKTRNRRNAKKERQSPPNEKTLMKMTGNSSRKKVFEHYKKNHTTQKNRINNNNNNNNSVEGGATKAGGGCSSKRKRLERMFEDNIDKCLQSWTSFKKARLSTEGDHGNEVVMETRNESDAGRKTTAADEQQNFVPDAHTNATSTHYEHPNNDTNTAINTTHTSTNTNASTTTTTATTSTKSNESNSNNKNNNNDSKTGGDFGMDEDKNNNCVLPCDLMAASVSTDNCATKSKSKLDTIKDNKMILSKGNGGEEDARGKRGRKYSEKVLEGSVAEAEGKSEKINKNNNNFSTSNNDKNKTTDVNVNSVTMKDNNTKGDLVIGNEATNTTTTDTTPNTPCNNSASTCSRRVVSYHDDCFGEENNLNEIKDNNLVDKKLQQVKNGSIKKKNNNNKKKSKHSNNNINKNTITNNKVFKAAKPRQPVSKDPNRSSSALASRKDDVINTAPDHSNNSKIGTKDGDSNNTTNTTTTTTNNNNNNNNNNNTTKRKYLRPMCYKRNIANNNVSSNKGISAANGSKEAAPAVPHLQTSCQSYLSNHFMSGSGYMDPLVQLTEHLPEVQKLEETSIRDRSKDSKTKNKRKKKSKAYLERRKERQQQSKQHQQGTQAKKPPCKFYVNGCCNKGQACPFDHAIEQVRKADVCKFYVMSQCTKPHCLYYHSDWPCKYLHLKGVCHNGDQCKFSHQPLTTTTKALLRKIIEDEKTAAEIAQATSHQVNNTDNLKNSNATNTTTTLVNPPASSIHPPLNLHPFSAPPITLHPSIPSSLTPRPADFVPWQPKPIYVNPALPYKLVPVDIEGDFPSRTESARFRVCANSNLTPSGDNIEIGRPDVGGAINTTQDPRLSKARITLQQESPTSSSSPSEVVSSTAAVSMAPSEEPGADPFKIYHS